MSRIAVITNPNAGGNRRAGHQRHAALRAVVGPAAIVREPSTLDELAEVASELRAHEVDVLAVCGGDGSYFRTLTAVAAAYGDAPLPALLPLRGGSMNTIARAVGHRRGTPESALAAAVQRLAAGERLPRTTRQLIRVNDGYLGFLTGVGAVVRFLASYYARPGRGPLAAARVTAEAVVSAAVDRGMTRGMFAPFRARARCDGEELAFERYSVVFAASVAELGLGFRVAYLADRKPGHFHVLAGQPRPVELAPRLLHIKAGWPLRLDSLYDNLAREVAVELAEPEPFMIDGDLLEPVRRITFAAGPRIEIVLPC